MEIKNLTREEFVALIPQIERLHKRSFGTDFSEGYLEWRYLKNPEKKAFVCVAMDGDVLAAFHAAIPLSITYCGKEYRAAMTSNGMTDPLYNGQGLFTKVTDGVFSQLLQNECMTVMGFPNVHSNHILCVQLKYRTVYEVPMLELSLDDACRNEKTPVFDDQFSLQYPLLNNRYDRIEVKKDPEYLRWRYTESPENIYRNIVVTDTNRIVQAFAVCKIWKDKLNLVEFHAEDIGYAAELLDRCVAYAKGIGCGAVTVWEPLNTELHYFLEKQKFINRYPIHYFNVKPFNGFEKKVDCMDPRNWALQMGDNNTY